MLATAAPGGQYVIAETRTAGGALTNGIATAFASSNINSGSMVLGTNFNVLYLNAAGATVATNPNGGSVTAAQIVVQFSNPGVTPVKLDAFTATAEGFGTLLAWHSVSEFQNAGYSVYRRTIGDDAWTSVNKTLIGGRLTNADEHTYHLYDSVPSGTYEYRLESIAMNGVREDYAFLAGPVTIDDSGLALEALSDDGVDAVVADIQTAAQSNRVLEVGEQFAAVQNEIVATARELDPNKPSDFATLTPRSVTPAQPVSTFDASVAARWFSPSQSSSSGNYTAAKVVYSAPGVLAIPQASLPSGFDINHVSITRGGVVTPALAIMNNTLYVFAPGYSDDYTNQDALFLRTINGNTAVSSANTATGLFGTKSVATSAATSVTANYHDVYFDYSTNFRPYVETPWFSSQYLTDGTDQPFTLATPFASGNSASLSVNVWSLTTDPNNASPDHALQVLVNGQPAGQTTWTGGGKLMQLSFTIPAGVLNSSSTNTIELVTPTLPNVTGQIALLHSLQISYTKSLDGSQPLTINNTVPNQIYEVGNLTSGGAWVIDARFPNTPTLASVQYQTQPDGSQTMRFAASVGGTGQYQIVPYGMENAPLSITNRNVTPLKANVKYLAVGPAQFASGTQPLIALHTKEGLRGMYVDQEQLFDYYGFGRYGPTPIQTAIRSVQPQYVLLVGRTTYGLSPSHSRRECRSRCTRRTWSQQPS